MPTTRRKANVSKIAPPDDISMVEMIGNGFKLFGSALIVLIMMIMTLAIITYCLMLLWEWVMGVHIV